MWHALSLRRAWRMSVANHALPRASGRDKKSRGITVDVFSKIPSEYRMLTRQLTDNRNSAR